MKEELVIIKTAELFGQEFNGYGTIDDPLFVAKDIAKWIEHSNTSSMVMNLEEGTEKVIRNVYTQGGVQEVLLLTEFGVYEVLMTSRKEKAKELKHGIKAFLRAWRLGEVKVVSTEELEQALAEKNENDANTLNKWTAENPLDVISEAFELFTKYNLDIPSSIMKAAANSYETRINNATNIPIQQDVLPKIECSSDYIINKQAIGKYPVGKVRVLEQYGNKVDCIIDYYGSPDNIWVTGKDIYEVLGYAQKNAKILDMVSHVADKDKTKKAFEYKGKNMVGSWLINVDGVKYAFSRRRSWEDTGLSITIVE